MSNDTFWKLMFGGFFAGIGAVVAIAGLVYASGATFGQRCDRLFPHGDALTMERCVAALSKGKIP